MGQKAEDRKPPASLNDYLVAMGDTIAVLTWCWREFVNARARAWMRRAILLSFCSRVVSLAYPFLMGIGIDGLIRHNGTQAIFAVVGTGVTYVLGSLVEWRMGRNIELTLGENLRTLERRINELFFEKELGLHLEEGSQLTQANMEKGYNRFHSAQQSLLFGGMDAVMTLGVTWTMLLLISPPSAAIVLCAIFASLFVSLHLNRFVVAGMDPIDERFRKLHRRRAERWEGVERVVTSGRDAAEVTEMDTEFERTIEDERRVWLPYLRGTVLRSLLNGLAVTTVGLFAGLRVWNGDMSMADLVPVLTWSGMASQQMRFIARVEREVNWCTPSLRSLREALTLPVRVTDAPDAVDLAPGPLHLELRDVCFRYAHARSSPDGAARQVLRGITLTVEPGQKVALIGPSGSGKSTLARLLQRYWDPDAGAILVNGIDLRRVRLRAWRESTASILQRAHVFDGTLRSNLTYALDRERVDALTDEAIWDHMRLLRVDFGSRLHQGLDTPRRPPRPEALRWRSTARDDRRGRPQTPASHDHRRSD